MADAFYQTINNRAGLNFSTASATNHSLDANNDGLSAMFQANSVDPITHVGFRYGSRTGTPPTYLAALEGIAADGTPDAVVKGGGSPASVTFTPPADTTWNGTWRWFTLANAYTPSVGEFLAMTIRYSSGTVDGSNFSSFTRLIGVTKHAAGFPRMMLLTGGTWAVTNGAVFAYRTASGRYGFIQSAAFTTTINTVGHRTAMHFTEPIGHGSTFKIAGLSAVIQAPSANAIIGVWNAAGTPLQTVTVDPDHFAGTNPSCVEFYFTTRPDLSFGTEYYIGVEVVTNVAHYMQGIQLAEAEDRSSFPNGTNRGYATWNGSSWTKDNTVMPLCELIFADRTVLAAGGGGLIVGSSSIIRPGH